MLSTDAPGLAHVLDFHETPTVWGYSVGRVGNVVHGIVDAEKISETRLRS